MPDLGELRGLIRSSELEVLASGQVLPTTLTHQWIVAPPHRRTETLLHLLGPHPTAVMVFVQRRDIAESIQEVLTSRGFASSLLHGGLTPMERTRSISEFREGQSAVLVSTDLVARGLDIPECTQVRTCLENTFGAG